MQKQLLTQLTAGVRKCRVCQADFIGHGTLCPTHAAELAAQIAQANAESEAITEARIEAQQAERKARRRTELVEAV